MNRQRAAVLAATALLLPGCACGWWRPESERSLEIAEQAFVGRVGDDAAATRRNLAGIPGWFESEFRNSGRNLRSTFDLYTDCPEDAAHERP